MCSVVKFWFPLTCSSILIEWMIQQQNCNQNTAEILSCPVSSDIVHDSKINVVCV
eukprot:m.943591 g.943591  ORF g.943591 m.943591 type:complete len:55 (+) comp23840_c0_seq29:91-255(+)